MNQDLIKTLSCLYDRRLQTLLGYKDYRFTEELVTYLFVRVRQISDKEKDGHYHTLITRAIVDILNWRNEKRIAYLGMTDLIVNLERYIKETLDDFWPEWKNETDDYRKLITLRFFEAIKKEPDAYPAGLNSRNLIRQLRLATSRRNKRVHNESTTKTYIYERYKYLCANDQLLAYLVYTFYHMVFAGVARESAWLMSVHPAPSQQRVRAECALPSALSLPPSVSPANPLEMQQDWAFMHHIYADYILQPSSKLLFGKFASSPASMGDSFYISGSRRLKDMMAAARPEETQRRMDLKDRLEKINVRWNSTWCSALVEFCQLRLCGSQRDMQSYRQRMEKYCVLFQDILKEDNRIDDPVTISAYFREMLLDYLTRNVILSAGFFDRKVTAAKEVLRKVRHLYKGNSKDGSYIDFENNAYALALMNLMEDICADDAYPVECGHFLSVSEFLLALAVYVYMTELIIHRSRKAEGSPETDFIAYMKSMRVELW